MTLEAAHPEVRLHRDHAPAAARRGPAQVSAGDALVDGVRHRQQIAGVAFTVSDARS